MRTRACECQIGRDGAFGKKEQNKSMEVKKSAVNVTSLFCSDTTPNANAVDGSAIICFGTVIGPHRINALRVWWSVY